MTDNTPRIALLWADVETTGLSMAKDLMLELSFTATEYDGSPIHRIHKIPTTTLLIDHSYDDRAMTYLAATAFGNLSPVVREMHQKSGLWNDLSMGTGNPGGNDLVRPEDAVYQLGQLIHDLKNLYGYDEVILAGSSISFDRGFLAAQARRYGTRTPEDWGLSHRLHDVTQFRRLADSLGVSYPRDIDGLTGHRAKDDMERDMLQWRAIYAAMNHYTEGARA